LTGLMIAIWFARSEAGICSGCIGCTKMRALEWSEYAVCDSSDKVAAFADSMK
jgi:hypothetical protein